MTRKLAPAPELGVRGPPVVRPHQVVEVQVPCRGGQVGRHHLLLFGAGLLVCFLVSCFTLLLLTLFHTSLYFDCIDFVYFHWLLFLSLFLGSFFTPFFLLAGPESTGCHVRNL